MLLKLAQAGDPCLRRASVPLTREEILGSTTQDRIAQMRETMRDAPGVGLAAPQVGWNVQLAMIEDRAELLKELSAEQIKERERQAVPFHLIINPKISRATEPMREFFEGCLSLPGFAAVVPRFQSVTVECLDEKGSPRTIQASGWYARILQHEIDHLNGTLYIDRMYTRSFTTLDQFNRHWKNAGIGDVLEAIPAQARQP